MTVELQVTGIRCNLQCEYCYQDPMRQAGCQPPEYDEAAVLAAVQDYKTNFTMFGGEPLMLPLPKLIRLWEVGLERYGKNGIQTNGSMITEKHLDAFRQYKVSVGLSLDGPGALNAARSAGSAESTARATDRSQWALEQLLEHGCYERDGKPVMPSLIVTLCRANAGAQVRRHLKAWFQDLDRLGLTSVRLHLLETSSQAVADKWGLVDMEVLDTLEELEELEGSLKRLRFEFMTNLKKLLLADDKNMVCVWNACDPYTTEVVRGIDGAGHSQNCGRTNKDGVNWLKADKVSFERQLALYHTPHQDGGCQGCRFFLMCKGYCPGSALDGDWRNRTQHCSLIMRVLERTERGLEFGGDEPLSKAPDRLTIESEMLATWSSGKDTRLWRVVKAVREGEPRGQCGRDGNGHGDHYDASKTVHADAVQHTDEATEEHGDVPHGDHGDHGDSLGGGS